MPKRKEILEDIANLLATIKPVNLYQTNIGDNVVYWQDTDVEFSTNLVEYRDPYEEVKSVNLPLEKTLTVLISVIQVTESVFTVGCQILEDLEKAFAEFTVKEGKLFIKSNEKTVETKGKKSIKVTVKLEIMYREEL
jgi:hypothetical protein